MSTPASPITAWDANGNPIQPPAPARAGAPPTAWDAAGNPVTPGAPIGRTPATGVTGVLSGIGAGVFETAQGAKNLVNKALPNSMQIPDVPADLRTQDTTSEKIGGGIETIGEFLLGDEALKGLDLAGRFGLSAKVAELAQQSPRLARALEIGMNAVRSGTVGAAQGATQASAENKPVLAGAEAGGTGAALGSAVGEAVVGPAINKVGEKLEEVVPKFGNALWQANKVKNFQYGKNPGRVFIDEGAPAIPPWQSYEDVERWLRKAGDNIAAEAQGMLSNSPKANAKIPVVPEIQKIINDALDGVSQRQGLTDRRGLINDIEDLRKELTQNFDAKGNSTGTKGPLTPAQITKLKTNIGRSTKWDPNKSPESQKILNNVRKSVYAYLDSEVDKAVPQMKTINERWANQIEAHNLIASRVAQEQAAAYGQSAMRTKTVLGAGVELMRLGDPPAGAVLILNEAARMPAARIATAKAANLAGKALQKTGSSLPQKAGAVAGAKSGENSEE